MFLEKSELKTVSTDEIINKIINNDDAIVTEIIEESIDVMRGYLFKYFDTDAIFSAVETSRSKTILKHLKSIVRYELYSRRSKVMNEVAKLAYDEAILWLEKVAAGKIEPDLPIKVIDTNSDGTPDTPATFMKLGSRTTYGNHW